MPLIVFLFVVFFAAGEVRAGGMIDFGAADQFTLSQPIVQTQVGSYETFLNEYLLDTGASGILVGAAASQELTSAGLQTVATYYDYGVAGTQATQVSAPYDFYFAGADGVPLTLPNTRIQTSTGDFAFYAGIAGMPLMMNRTVGLDLAAQTNMEALRIGVSFSSAAPPPTGVQYSVPLSMYEFPMTGQEHPADPLPVYAPLPFAPVKAHFGSTTKTGSWLLDTGAQQCILSSATAFELGLDANGNGDLDDEAIDFQTVAGVGGSVVIPVLQIDALSLQTTAGVDLTLRDIPVGIIDIDPSISGVLGMNILNTGWEIHALNLFLGIDPGPPGLFDRVDLDFRGAAATMQGEMRLTVNAQRVEASAWEVAAGSTLSLGSQPAATVNSLANEGLLDVGSSKLSVATGLTAVALVDWIVAGRNGGTWDGAAGVTSAEAAAADGTRAVGWLDNGDGSFTFGFAAQGDTNLDGQVGLDDLMNILAAGKYGSGTGATWAEGDFNYDGVVDLTDLIDVLATGVYGQGSYLATTNSVAGSGLAPTVSRNDIDLNGLAAAFPMFVVVPEPAAWLVAIQAATTVLLVRRRRV